MTVSTINSVAEFVTNGATTNFPFFFKFLDSRDLVVTYIDPEDVSTVLVMGTQYTVSGAGNDRGGSVTTTTVLRGPGKLIVSRDMEAYQQTSLRNQGKFLAETHEDVFDRLTMLVQQGFAIFKRALTRPFGRDYFYAEGRRITDVADPVNPHDAVNKGYADTIAAEVASYTDRQILRTVRSADGETLTQLPPAASRANKVMGFDSAGQPIGVLPASGSGTELAIDLANTIDPNKGVGLVPTAVALADSAALLRNRANKNNSFLCMSPAGNPDAYSHYTKTGNVVPGKARASEPPYIYDAVGNEYIEKRSISFQYVPPTILDDSPKLVAVSPFVAGQVLVALRKKDAGYLLLGLSNNVTTNAADSLAETTSDPTMLRVVSIQSAVSVVVGNLGIPAESGAWTRVSLGTVLPEVPPSTSSNAYTYLNTQARDASLSYAGMISHNGVVALSFLCSPQSNASAKVSVDGVTYTVNLASLVVKVRTFRFNTSKDSVSVVVTNYSESDSYTLNFLGQNFSTLEDWNGSVVSAWGYYRNSAVADYVISNSENEYTMKEHVTEIYGGGYHGGETGIIDTVKVDGVAHSPTLVPKVGRKLAIESACNISWASVGSPSAVIVRKSFNFVGGGYYYSLGVTGSIVVSELYSALLGVSVAFGEIDAPTPKVITSAVGNLQRLNLGRSSKVIMRNAATGQRVVAEYTVHQNDSASQYGGAYVWRVDGAYHKLYYNIAHGGRLPIESNYTYNKYEFY